MFDKSDMVKKTEIINRPKSQKVEQTIRFQGFEK